MIIQIQKRGESIQVTLDAFDSKKKVLVFATMELASEQVRKACATRIKERICLEDYTTVPARILHYEKGVAGHSVPSWLDEDGVGHNWKFAKLTDAERAKYADLLI